MSETTYPTPAYTLSTATAPPALDPPIILTERERELVITLRLLQSQRKYCKLIAEFENGVMRFGVWLPQVKWK